MEGTVRATLPASLVPLQREEILDEQCQTAEALIAVKKSQLEELDDQLQYANNQLAVRRIDLGAIDNARQRLEDEKASLNNDKAAFFTQQMGLHTALMAFAVAFPTVLPQDVSITTIVQIAKQAFELANQDRDQMRLKKLRLQIEKDHLIQQVAQFEEDLLSKDTTIYNLEADKIALFLSVTNTQRGRDANTKMLQSLLPSLQETMTAAEENYALPYQELSNVITMTEVLLRNSRKRARQDDSLGDVRGLSQRSQQATCDTSTIDQSILGQRDVESISSDESIPESRQASIDLTPSSTIAPSSNKTP